MFECVDLYKSLFGLDDSVPEMDEDGEEEGEEEMGWNEQGQELEGLFKVEKVIKIIRRYGQHKSPGIDSIHISLLSSLCPTSEKEEEENSKSQDHSNSSRLSPTPFLIPTQPATLNPLAPSFIPRDSSPEGPADFPFFRILSSLFRLAAASGHTPTRWGNTSLTLISKLKSQESPLPSETRPIALLPMFRRLFEILLLPHFDPLGHKWAHIHPNQAGFCSGWSCSSSILLVDHHLSQDFPCSAFLDFSHAYDLPPPCLILRRFKLLGIPLLTRKIIWSLLTSGSQISLIVNGQQSPSFPRHRGFPQGAPLSPLLFNLYLNPLLEIINSFTDSPSDSLPDSSPDSPPTSSSRIESTNEQILVQEQEQTKKRKEEEKAKTKTKTKTKTKEDGRYGKDRSAGSRGEGDPVMTREEMDRRNRRIAAGWGYADDLGVGAKNGRILRLVLRAAELWAIEWGMVFNSKKCVLVGRSEVWEQELKGIWLGGAELRIVKKVRYLGTSRDGKGILWEEYMEQKVSSMDRLLGGLQVAGEKWSPLVRLTIYRTFCRSLIEFGGPLLHLFLTPLTQKKRTAALSALNLHHNNAVCWVLSVKPSVGHGEVASSSTGLSPPAVRLEHLAFGLSLFLNSAPSENPTRQIFLQESSYPIPLLSRNLHTLARLPLFERFREANYYQLQQQQPPFTRSTFLRQDLLRRFAALSTLSSYILPNNRPNGLLDGALSISTPPHRRAAILWRANLFGTTFTCFVCGCKFTRRCFKHTLEFEKLRHSDGQPISDEMEASIMQEVDRERNARNQTMRDPGQILVMDYLVGHGRKEYRDIGTATLQAWERRMRTVREDLRYLNKR